MTEYLVKTDRGLLRVPFDIEQIKLEESYFSETYDSTTLYFTLPKEWVSSLYPEACAAELSVEFPCAHPEPAFAQAEIAYTIEEDDAFIDCGWWDIELLPQDVGELLKFNNKIAVKPPLTSKTVVEECIEQIDNITSVLMGVITQSNMSGKAVADCHYANKCLLETRRTLLALKEEL